MGRPTNEEIIASIPEALPVGIWVARAPGGEFVYANRTFQLIMGTAGRSDVAVGTYAEPYGIHAPDGSLYPEHKMPFVRAIAEGTTVMVDDIVIHRTDGRKVSIRAYAHPVEYDGEIDHVIIAFFDISREVASERARQESERRMRRAQRLESVGNLAGGIAHDFNNLLGAIRMIATSLAVGERNSETLEALEAIDSATISAQELTRALLGFAGGGVFAEHDLLQLDAVVRRVVSLLDRALDPRHPVTLELGSPRPVSGDSARLEQVVMNLVLNARDAMPDGGGVTVRTSDRGQHVVLEVIDHGPGIPEEIRDRVFEPYFTTRSTSDSHGVGLGLATVYGIVSAHGGQIEVLPTETGAHFSITLPARDRAMETMVPEPPAARLPTPSQGLRVLVIDDEPLVAQAASIVLRTLGHEPTVYHRATEAIAYFATDPAAIDLVLLDLAMPDMDGRGAYKALRDIDPGVRVILATGYALNAESQALLDLGVRTFLDKPYGIAQLQDAIKRALD